MPYGAAQALCQHEGAERSGFGGEFNTFPLNSLNYFGWKLLLTVCLMTFVKLVEEPRSLIQVGFIAGDTCHRGAELPLEGTIFLACGSISSLGFLENLSQRNGERLFGSSLCWYSITISLAEEDIRKGWRSPLLFSRESVTLNIWIDFWT